MLGNSNKQNNNELIILKLKTADAEKKPVPVHFEITKKVGDKWTATGEIRDVSGKLTGLELYEREWEGNVYPLVKVFVEDEAVQETYLLDLRYNMLSRSLFNSLLSLSSFDDVQIAVRDRKKGEKTFPAVYVNQGGKKVDWKYQIADLPPIEKVKVGKTEVTNFDNLNDFFVKELGGLSAALKSQLNKPGAPKSEATVPVVDSDEEVGDNIPF